MNWDYAPLDTQIYANDAFFVAQLAKGDALIASAQADIDNLIAQGIDDINFDNIGLNLADPSAVNLSLPVAPATSDIVTPTLGSDPDSALILELFATTKAALTARLADATVESAVFGRAVDRETALQAESYNNYLASQAANGFSSPSGQDAAVFIAFETQKKQKLSDINRDVMIAKFEADQKTLEALMQLETQAKDFYNAQEDVMIRRATLLDQFNQTLISNKKMEVEIYAATSSAAAEHARFLVSQLEAVSSQSSLLAKLAMDKVKYLADFHLSKYNAIGESVKGISAIKGQYAATLANMMNYSMSFGYGHHYSGSVNVSV